MKASGDRKSLLDAIHRVMPVASARSNNPLYACVQLFVRDSQLAMTAVNQQFMVDTTTGMGAEGDVATVDAGRLQQAIANLQGDAVSLSGTESKLRIKCGRATVELPAQSTNLTRLPDFTPTAICTAPAEQLYKAAMGVQGFAEDATDKFTLDVLRLEVRGNRLACVTSNGRAILARYVPCEMQDGKEFAAMAPTKLARMLGGLSGTATLSVGGSAMCATDGKTAIMALQINGRFVQWGSLLKMKRGDLKELSVPLSPIISACRLASATFQRPTEKDELQSPRMNLSVDNGELHIGCKTELGETEDVMLVQDGVSGKVQLSADFLRTALTACGQESALLRVGGDLHIESEGFEGFVLGME